MKFEKINPGDRLFDVHSYRMGNTTLRSVGVWEVEIIDIDPEKRCATVSWNGNKPEVYNEVALKKLRAVRPELEAGFFGSMRIKAKAKTPKTPEAA